MEILRIQDLKTHFHTESGIVKAVDGVSFTLARGETLGIAGESGAGKSVTTLTVMGMARKIGAGLVSGEVWYNGVNLFEKPELYKDTRGKKISLIPQEIGPSLNPVIRVGDQIEEMITVHMGVSAGQAKDMTLELLESVELHEPAVVSRLYPHQLSGGMLQRVVMAMALSCAPEILIADEPASSLDTAVQDQILKLLRDIKELKGLSSILVAHDLGVISKYCDRVMIMYSGRVVEIGPVSKVLNSPGHPYTVSLLEIYRSFDMVNRNFFFETGSLIRSNHQSGINTGCGYAERCQWASGYCIAERPFAVSIGPDHLVYCHKLSNKK